MLCAHCHRNLSYCHDMTVPGVVCDSPSAGLCVCSTCPHLVVSTSSLSAQNISALPDPEVSHLSRGPWFPEVVCHIQKPRLDVLVAAEATLSLDSLRSFGHTEASEGSLHGMSF